VARPPLEVADVLRDLVACRTARLGGHVESCDSCDFERIAYNSCRNRHCPKCQAAARGEWLEARAADLLPVEYFHVVFTLPAEIAELALQNKKAMYGILMRAAAATLLQVAADPRHLGARIGFLAVLHTWGQNLLHHPHVHCVVPGGGLSPDGSRWISCAPGFFLPVRVLGPVFRGKFLDLVRQAFARGELLFQGALAELNERAAFATRLRESYRHDWVVYAKPPFGGPGQVLKYLARYTHRVAISNHRLVAMRDDRVTFRFKDYARGSRMRTMSLEAVEFIRRFLLHTLPRGFVRIRHLGLFANPCRNANLVRCRELLGVEQARAPCHEATVPQAPDQDKARRCPLCKRGTLSRRRLTPAKAIAWQPRSRSPPVAS
jgi:hypothetical protein